MSARAQRRRWLAPEVVQTSAMDCGPAALKCLLEGHHVAASYGRLREACQTDVDGTSIDTLEVVARQLGLDARQEMLPLDHLLPPGGGTAPLPALVVVRHADVATHFVVVWRRLGRWLQVMDPALGRRWVTVERLRADLYRHEAEVPAADWRAWAASDEFTDGLRQRLAALGLGGPAGNARIARALSQPGWLAIATLDAAVRLLQSLHAAGGVAAGDAAGRLLDALCTRAAEGEATAVLPEGCWSVRPTSPATGPGTDAGAPATLRLRGAVLLRVAGRRDAAAPPGTDDADAPLPPELAAALREPPARPLATVARLLREDGLAAPLALAAAMVLATGAVMAEALLLRGLLDVGTWLQLPGQRLGALAVLLAFMAVLAALEVPILAELLRQGRHLETRLRMALMHRLPRLNDRYFQSRPLSDMADRSHALQLLRAVPALGFQTLQALAELLLTLAAVALIAPASAPLALVLGAAAVALPLLAQPALNERDLRARNHHAALNGFYLDALLGLVAVRAHRAQANVARAHESLLVAWAEAALSSLRIGLLAGSAQALVCTALAAALLVQHLLRTGGVAGADLMLVFWVLKLPALGGRLAALARQYPAQRNVLLRLLEPLSAPLEGQEAPAPRPPEAGIPPLAESARGLRLSLEVPRVRAGGHVVLQDLRLDVAPGEHVAVVGASGAGKSTLLGLLLGWHPLGDGELRVDGRRVDAADLPALRAATAWVDPAVQLWNRPLLENLAYAAAPQDLPQLSRAVRAAHLRETLARLPQGLQTLVGEGGGLLSGGEGQRVRLARALLAGGTRLALLDEPFRGLDRTQRRALLAEARAWWQGVTLLCVTHDVAETQGFDRVLVVHEGRVVEDGAPATLAGADTRYRALLQAEQRLQQALWGAAHWRRLTVQGGRVLPQAAGDAP